MVAFFHIVIAVGIYNAHTLHNTKSPEVFTLFILYDYIYISIMIHAPTVVIK